MAKLLHTEDFLGAPFCPYLSLYLTLQLQADGFEALAGCHSLELIDLGKDLLLTPGNTETTFDSKVRLT